jgi:hypothetical protein
MVDTKIDFAALRLCILICGQSRCRRRSNTSVASGDGAPGIKGRRYSMNIEDGFLMKREQVLDGGGDLACQALIALVDVMGIIQRCNMI